MSTPSLDDCLSLYVQLDPDDAPSSAAGLRDLRERLWTRMLDFSTEEGERPGLAAAIARIDRQGALEPVGLGATYRELASLLEAIGAPGAAPGAPPAPAATAPRAPVTTFPAEGALTGAAITADAVLTLAADADTALLTDFVMESREYLDQAEAALLQLEGTPDDAEAINTVFRAFHTIKGSSSFLGLPPVAEFAHHAETLLTRIRSREIPCAGGYANLALSSLDMLKELMARVQRMIAGEDASLPAEYQELLATLMHPEAAGVGAGDAGSDGAPRSLVERDAASRPAASAREARRGQGGDTLVRVRTDRLDRLIEMVGELVIAEAMVAQDPIVRTGGHHELARKVAHAGKIVRELQDLSMGMRMVPLKGPIQKVARLVRDLAQRSGKLVEFHAEGEDTEIDRNLVDIIADPLVHMVRNAVDHGIEAPDDRAARGKPRTGQVRIAAYHAGGNVVVELHDDGRGLGRDRILRKAVAQGLVDAAAADTMSDTEVHNLIFAPGFSTAEEVTDVSGRGVGMDVVRRNVESVRGRCDIASRPGRGTTFSLRLPLTLAITDGMVVRAGQERYIIPTAGIIQSIRPAPGSLVTFQGRGEMVNHRETLYPVVRLHHVFGIEGAEADPERALLVIVGDARGHTALLVDDLIGQQQVVAKSLGDAVGQVRGLAGGAILADGQVGLIIDVAELVRIAQESPSAGITMAQRAPAALACVA
ncbi:MAG: chemotaxis protein CheA [Gemmatimonadaceae bacterium]